MPVYKLNVKWQKERFKDVECDTDEHPEKFKAVLFSLTGVPPERQKVMMPGKILGDANFDGVKLKDGATIMLMGTANDSLMERVEHVEMNTDSSQHTEKQDMKLPFGLVNLGNTCYMNAAVQLLYAVPELRAVVTASPSLQISPGTNVAESLLPSLRLLFESMGRASQSVIPAVFVTCLRTVCPQFATRLPGDKGADADTPERGILSMLGGHFAQQDANECWVELMHALQRLSVDPQTNLALPDLVRYPTSSEPWNPVERYFTGRLSCKLTCTEAEEEPSETQETFIQLSCFINQDVKFLHTGIRNGFEGTVTKLSATLGRNAVYKKTSVITRLPAYLSVHFIRFFYKEDKKLNAKILKDVKFPLELDLFTFCSDALQKDLLPIREKMRQQEDREVHRLSTPDRSSVPAPTAEKNPELFAPYSLPSDPGSNNSGYYDLMGVLSHQGRTSSSGHYVAWVKVKGTWVKFDDEVVTAVTPEDILRLSGGGDWHCAYILLYGPKRLLKEDHAADASSNSISMPVNRTSTATEPTTLQGDGRIK